MTGVALRMTTGTRDSGEILRCAQDDTGRAQHGGRRDQGDTGWQRRLAPFGERIGRPRPVQSSILLRLSVITDVIYRVMCNL